jgi:hypothetical protein
MMVAARTSETLVNVYLITRRYSPEDIIRAMSLIALMMEAARTSETLVNFYQTTRRYNPEDRHFHTHRRDNLKSYNLLVVLYGCESWSLTLTEKQVSGNEVTGKHSNVRRTA